MSVADIRQWLKDPRSFVRGRLLYLQYGQSRVLKKRLAKGESAYTRTRLMEELKAIADRSDRFEVPPSHSTPETKAVPREQLPPHLQTQDVRKGKLFKQASKMHRQLAEVATDRERKQLAGKILENFALINGIHREIDHYRDHRPAAPEGEAKRTVKLKDFLLRYKNLPSYLTKARKRLAKLEADEAKPRELEKVRSRLKAYELELEGMEQTIEEGVILV